MRRPKCAPTWKSARKVTALCLWLGGGAFAIAGDDHVAGKHKYFRLNPFKVKGHEVAPGQPLSMVEVANRIDIITEGVRDDGSIVIKQPDVYSNAKTTKYRRDFEKQISQELDNFRLIIAARNARLDFASLTSQTSLGAALTGTTTPALPTGPTVTAATIPTAPALGFNAQGGKLDSFSTGMGIEPTIYLDQEKRFIDHLNELRRVNMGVDRDESAGYGLYLVRLPVSILPGQKTREGYGAELMITAQHEFPPSFLAGTYRNLVINDLVDQLGPVLYEYIRTGRVETSDKMKVAKNEIVIIKNKSEILYDVVKEKINIVNNSINEIIEGIGGHGALARKERDGSIADRYMKKVENNFLPETFMMLSAGKVSDASDDKMVREWLVDFVGGEDLRHAGDDAFVGDNSSAMERRLHLLSRLAAKVKAKEGVLINNDMKIRIDSFCSGVDRLAELAGIQRLLYKTIDSFVDEHLGVVLAIVGEIKVVDAKLYGDVVKEYSALKAANREVETVRGEISRREKELELAKVSNLSSGRSPKRDYPIAVPDISDVFLEENLIEVTRIIQRLLPTKQPLQADVRGALRQLLGAAYDAMARPASQELGMSAEGDVAPVLGSPLIEEIHQAVQQRAFAAEGEASALTMLHGRLLAALETAQKNVRNSAIGPLGWAIAVDAGLLDFQMRDSIARFFAARGLPCPNWEAIRFYQDDPVAHEVFCEFVRHRWPIVTFAIDPVFEQQNVNDAFLLNRDMQLALAFAFSTGQINFQQLNTFRRNIQQQSETISLNRTVTAFSMGNDVFGYRFQPRFQNPPMQKTNIHVAMSQLISGGPGPDYATRKSKLEPGIRELTMVMTVPTFLTSMRVESAGNWYRLTDPDDLKITSARMIEQGREVMRLRDQLAQACNANQYRPDDVRVLASKIRQVESMLNMQSSIVPLPYEKTTSGFELFTEGSVELAPELLGFDGIDGINPEKEGSIFLFGKNISIHETKVVIGGKELDEALTKTDAQGHRVDNSNLQVDILSREIVRIKYPANSLQTTTLSDGKEVIEIYLATPNGISNRLSIPLKGQKAAAPASTGYNLSAKEISYDVELKVDPATRGYIVNAVDVTAPDKLEIQPEVPVSPRPQEVKVTLKSMTSDKTPQAIREHEIGNIKLNDKAIAYVITKDQQKKLGEFVASVLASAPTFNIDEARTVEAKEVAVATDLNGEFRMQANKANSGLALKFKFRLGRPVGAAVPLPFQPQGQVWPLDGRGTIPVPCPVAIVPGEQANLWANVTLAPPAARRDLEPISVVVVARRTAAPDAPAPYEIDRAELAGAVLQKMAEAGWVGAAGVSEDSLVARVSLRAPDAARSVPLGAPVILSWGGRETAANVRPDRAVRAVSGDPEPLPELPTTVQEEPSAELPAQEPRPAPAPTPIPPLPAPSESERLRVKSMNSMPTSRSMFFDDGGVVEAPPAGTAAAAAAIADSLQEVLKGAEPGTDAEPAALQKQVIQKVEGAIARAEDQLKATAAIPAPNVFVTVPQSIVVQTPAKKKGRWHPSQWRGLRLPSLLPPN